MPRTGLGPEETRDLAISIALELIRTRGADKLRLTDVAREMDVSHTALYAHFANKAALLEAVVGFWLSGTEEKLAAIVSAPGDPMEKIAEWFTELHTLKVARAAADPALYGAVNTSTVRETSVAERHVAVLRDQLAELAKAAALPDPKQSADLLMEATTAFHHPALIAIQRGEPRLDTLRGLLAVMMKGLK